MPVLSYCALNCFLNVWRNTQAECTVHGDFIQRIEKVLILSWNKQEEAIWEILPQ